MFSESPINWKPTDIDKIRKWLVGAEERGATHMIVFMDRFDGSVYPTNVLPGQTAANLAKDDKEKLIRVMEVYNMSSDLEAQLKENRAFNF